ncbi:MAG TPA: LD-carboxypeptidase [Magnetospirillaceae bacterium]|nr:LD-carboxypeptidase [Magnetospirillaceae bacterium]
MALEADILKPEVLEPGAHIRVISPASGLWKRSELERGLSSLRTMGFRVSTGRYAYNTQHYLAGPDEARAQDFQEAFEDPDVDAVLCSQGGYGSARLFPYLDFARIGANPKPFIGYSDITALHLMLGSQCGLVTFHGPGATGFERGFLTDYTKTAFLRALCSTEPLGMVRLPDPIKEILTLHPGIAEGPLVGGNLTLICASLGTPYEIDTRGAILFFEELDTEPWILDHLLTHLGNAGKLRDAAGFAVGECMNCEPQKLDPGFFTQRSFEDILYEIFTELGKPAIYGLPIGHNRDRVTVPLGVEARLDATSGAMTLLEGATVSSGASGRNQSIFGADVRPDTMERSGGG